MDFRFSEAEEKLRSEVRQFLQEHMPELDPVDRVGSIGGLVVSENAFEKAMVFNKKLAERGWIAPGWPKEYGGLDASIYEQMVFNEEFGYVGPPDTGTRVLGVGLLGLLSNEVLLLGIAIFGYMTCWQQKQMLRAGDGFEESEFGYDFSQGYTSLGRSMEPAAKPKRPSLLQRWRQARAERREQREHERRLTEERRLDALLEKVHTEGLQSLTPTERRFLDYASQKRR